MGIFDILFGNKKEKERLQKERLAEQERQRQAEERKIAEEREKRLSENRRKEAERKAKIEAANSKKYQILDFYLDCSYCKEQADKLQVIPLALPIKRVDVEVDEDIVQKYHVNNLPKLILVDLNGKEIKRWKGITNPIEINNYLYDNGYAERPKYAHQQKSSDDKFKQIDLKLASQFTVESLSNDLEYTPSGYSDDFYVSELQKQYMHYCLMAKSNLAMDAAGQAHPLMIALKNHIKSYIADSKNNSNKAMKYLYESAEIDTLVQQIGMLSLHANMKHVKDVANITPEEFHLAMEPENVCLAIGLYTYFTIVTNKNITVDKFNQLFVETWLDYYEKIQVRWLMIKMRGNDWKDEFKGVLLDD